MAKGLIRRPVVVVDPIGEVLARRTLTRWAVYAVDLFAALTYGGFLVLYLIATVGLPVAVGVLGTLVWLGVLR